MLRSNKIKIIDFLEEEFKSANTLVICGFTGLTHKKLELLRQYATENGVKVKVVKNSFTMIAIKKAGLDELSIVENNIAIWSEDQISACKVADNFANDNKDKFFIKTGYIENKVVDIATINAMAKLPSRDELIAMLLSVWTAPARNFVTGLDNLRAKIEEAA
jgi:large subunit ribosomal protein L10